MKETKLASDIQKIIEQYKIVFIDEKSRGSRLADRVLDLFPADKVKFVTERPFSHSHGTLTAKQYEESKSLLYITRFEGQFFKRCPGFSQKRALACCNYYVLNLGMHCSMNCSYCYLQSYLRTPVTEIYSNIEDALSEIEEMANQYPDLPYRVGTGEVTDSLSLDPLTLYSRDLIGLFKKYPKWTLELKTKSDCIEAFLDSEHAGNTIIGWSINSEFVCKTEELGTASLEARLAAARKVADKGFKVAFHIDPLLYYPDWKNDYLKLCECVNSLFKPGEIQTITAGALRFQPEQRHVMRERFGMKSLVTRAEVFPSEGNKLRYDSRIRNEMYRYVIESFKSLNSKWQVYLCMETPETWLTSLEKLPMQFDELKEMFRPLPKIKSEGDQDKGSCV